LRGLGKNPDFNSIPIFQKIKNKIQDIIGSGSVLFFEKI
jgi:hypothetical protein